MNPADPARVVDRDPVEPRLRRGLHGAPGADRGAGDVERAIAGLGGEVVRPVVVVTWEGFRTGHRAVGSPAHLDRAGAADVAEHQVELRHSGAGLAWARCPASRPGWPAEVAGDEHRCQQHGGDRRRRGERHQPGVAGTGPAPGGNRGRAVRRLLRGRAVRHQIRGGAERVAEPGRGTCDLIRIVHGISLRARASSARPRAAVDLTVPALTPSVAAISASERSR